MKMKVTAILIICCVILTVFSGCGKQQEESTVTQEIAAESTAEEELPTVQESTDTEENSSVKSIREYSGYDEMTANEYSRHLQKVFVSLLPECMDADSYGLGILHHNYGSMGEEVPQYGQVSSAGGGIYWIDEAELPAFYGLLMETETILTELDLLHRDGNTVILYADEVAAVASLLLHTDVTIGHRSVCGAEFDEAAQCYRYEKLDDPLKPFYDKGWELLFLGSESEDDPNAETLCVNPYWQDRANGDLYTFQGELLCTKCQRELLTGDLYTNYMIKLGLWHYGDNAVPTVHACYYYGDDEEGAALPFDKTTPIGISLGTSSMIIPDPAESGGEMVDVELNEEGQ